MKVVYCRAAYCPRCHARGSPQKKETATLYGNGKQSYYLTTVYGGIRGFTPHIFTVLARKNGVVVVEKVCSIDGCGVDLEWNDKKNLWDIIKRQKSIIELPYADFNALVQHPDLGYRVD